MTRRLSPLPMDRRFRASRGLAEIVGTLMLVLIVVAAATAFSFFVASYQQQLQAQQTASHDRALEAVHVLSVLTKPVNASDPTFANLTFTIGSGDVNPMSLTDLVVNGNPAISYNATWLSNNSRVSVGIKGGDAGSALLLPALEQIQISLDLNTTDPLFSFLSPSAIPTANSYLTIYLQTQRGSGFTFVYVPPTALSDLTFIQSFNGVVLTDLPVLDGTHSFQQGGNASIVAWSWTVTNLSALHHPSWPEVGAQVELTNLTATSSYSAALAVYNSAGLFGVAPSLTFLG